MSLAFNCDLGWCLFLHMPRTAGTWLENVLERQTPFTCQRMFPNGASRHGLPEHYKLHNYDYVFTIIRHPRTWYPSMWRFLKGHKWISWEPGRWHPWRVLERYADDDFNGWMEKLLANEPGYLTRYVEQVVGPVGKPKLNDVYLYENLQRDMGLLFGLCGMSISEARRLSQMPTFNYPCPEVERPEWNDATLAAMQAAEAPLIRRFYDEG
jgi:hypothetical protein